MFIVLSLINKLGTIDFWACAIVTLWYSLKYLEYHVKSMVRAYSIHSVQWYCHLKQSQCFIERISFHY